MNKCAPLVGEGVRNVLSVPLPLLTSVRSLLKDTNILCMTWRSYFNIEINIHYFSIRQVFVNLWLDKVQDRLTNLSYRENRFKFDKPFVEKPRLEISQTSVKKTNRFPRPLWPFMNTIRFNLYSNTNDNTEWICKIIDLICASFIPYIPCKRRRQPKQNDWWKSNLS